MSSDRVRSPLTCIAARLEYLTRHPPTAHENAQVCACNEWLNEGYSMATKSGLYCLSSDARAPHQKVAHCGLQRKPLAKLAQRVGDRIIEKVKDLESVNPRPMKPIRELLRASIYNPRVSTNFASPKLAETSRSNSSSNARCSSDLSGASVKYFVFCKRRSCPALNCQRSNRDLLC